MSDPMLVGVRGLAGGVPVSRTNTSKSALS
jgi:hypothetical protein